MNLKHLNLDAVPYASKLSGGKSTETKRHRWRGPTRRAIDTACKARDVIAELKDRPQIIAWIDGKHASMLDLIDQALTAFGPFDSLTLAIPTIGARHLRMLLEWREQGRVGEIWILRDSNTAGRGGDVRKLECKITKLASRKNRVRGFALVKGIPDGGPSESELKSGAGIFVAASCSMTVNRDYSDLVIASRDVAAAVDFREWVRAEIDEPKCRTERD